MGGMGDIYGNVRMVRYRNKIRDRLCSRVNKFRSFQYMQTTYKEGLGINTSFWTGEEGKSLVRLVRVFSDFLSPSVSRTGCLVSLRESVSSR